MAIGITNQRETLVVFDRRTLEPLAPAIVWQCRRSAGICAEHRARGEEAEIRRRTGLLLDPYFTATKLEWLLREDPSLAARAERGEVCAATVDTWLIARLTAGAVLATDPATRAGRCCTTCPAATSTPSSALSSASLPRCCRRSGPARAGSERPTRPRFSGSTVPVSGVAGDQQAALFGQACVEPGMSKNTYGTGSFLLVNVGETVPDPGNGLLATVAWRIDGRDVFALEGSIFVTGAALQWLRDGLGLIESAADAGPLFESVEDTRACIFVPALVGPRCTVVGPGRTRCAARADRRGHACPRGSSGR